jgi:hypothetical protein
VAVNQGGPAAGRGNGGLGVFSRIPVRWPASSSPLAGHITRTTVSSLQGTGPVSFGTGTGTGTGQMIICSFGFVPGYLGPG